MIASMMPIVAIIIFLLHESLKSDFLNYKVLITDVSFYAKVFWSTEIIFLKRVYLWNA